MTEEASEVSGPILKFGVNEMCEAEALLNMPMSAILGELKSDEGAKLSTLRALLAVSAVEGVDDAVQKAWRTVERKLAGRSMPYNLDAAAKLIEEYGIEVCAEAVGKALAESLGGLGKAAAHG